MATSTNAPKPATPLPWNRSRTSIRAPYGVTEARNIQPCNIGNKFVVACLGDDSASEPPDPEQVQDAAYIVHACNSLPQLVDDRARLIEALRKVCEGWEAIPEDDPVPESLNDGRMDNLSALLRELGEQP